jgi:hypothetical protein
MEVDVECDLHIAGVTEPWSLNIFIIKPENGDNHKEVVGIEVAKDGKTNKTSIYNDDVQLTLLNHWDTDAVVKF